MLDLARRAVPRAVVLAVGVLALVSACTPLTDDERVLFGATNSLRADHGVGPVYEHEPLTSAARAWARNLAAQGRLAHSDLRQLGVSWSAAAENVARAGSIQDAFAQLAESPTHRTNMLNRAYLLTGVGTARAKDGSVYAVQLFVRS